jgi:hypothetical protein
MFLFVMQRMQNLQRKWKKLREKLNETKFARERMCSITGLIVQYFLVCVEFGLVWSLRLIVFAM